MRSWDDNGSTVLFGSFGESGHAAYHDWELFVMGLIVTEFNKQIIPDQYTMQYYAITDSTLWQKVILTHHLDAELAISHQD
jgi:hypothetical protein